jgi:hypothetical protein
MVAPTTRDDDRRRAKKNEENAIFCPLSSVLVFVVLNPQVFALRPSSSVLVGWRKTEESSVLVVIPRSWAQTQSVFNPQIYLSSTHRSSIFVPRHLALLLFYPLSSFVGGWAKAQEVVSVRAPLGRMRDEERGRVVVRERDEERGRENHSLMS